MTTNMLTRIVSNRVYDFSHVVGGRQLTGIVQLALADGDDVYLVMRRRNGGNLMKLTIGPVPGDEEIVGQIGKSGAGQGEFVWPTAAAIDSNGNIYVTDEWLNRVTVFDREGNFVRTFGEQGSGEGQFDRPSGIAVDGDDNVIVSDTLNHRVQKLTPDGESIATWGCKGDGPGEFDSPWGVTTDGSGAVYVADHRNHRMQKFDSDGGFLFAIGSQGTGEDQFDHPSDVAVDPQGDIYVCDWVNNRVGCFDSEGAPITIFAGDAQELSKWQRQYVAGNPDVYKARRRVYSLEPEWRFALPMAVIFDDEKSRLMVVDSQRHRIQIYNKLTDYRDPQFNI